MAVRIKMEVDPKMIETLDALDEDTLGLICDDEMETRIDFLETLVRGWKSYKNVKTEHRRALFLMLCNPDKDGLQKYERLVLYPKILEMEKAKELLRLKETETSKVGSPTSTVELGADSSDNSGEDSSASPPPEAIERCPTVLFERVLSSDDQSDISDGQEVQEGKDTPGPSHIHTEVDCSCKQLTTAEEAMVDNALTELENSLLNNKSELEPLAKFKESPLSVVSSQVLGKYSQPRLNSLRNIISDIETKVAQGSVIEEHYEENPELANNISKAVLEVRKALDTVEILEAAQNSKRALTEDLVRLESKLLQSVVYIPSSDNDFDPIQKKEKEEQANDEKKPGVLKAGMTRSQKKRAKTAAKKAAEFAEANMRIAAEKAKEALHAKLAAEALATLAKKSQTPSTPEQNQLPETNDDVKFPLTDYEMKRFAELVKTGLEYPSNSEEGRIMSKYYRHQDEIKRLLIERVKVEAERNTRLVTESALLTSGTGPRTRCGPKDEEVWRTALNFVVEKQKFWQSSKLPQAEQYLRMYSHFLTNLTMHVAKLIVKFIPIESVPDNEFEKTLLIQYTAGNFPLPDVDEEIKV